MSYKFANQATATLASSITASGTSLTVTTGQGALFPSLGVGEVFQAALVDSSNNVEFVQVTARSGDAMTIVRAQEGSLARAYAAGSRIELRLTAAVMSNFATRSGSQTFSGSNTFSGATTFSGAATFSSSVALSGGGSLSGTFSGAATLSGVISFTGGGSLGTGTWSGNPTFSGDPLFTSSVRLANSKYLVGLDSGGTPRLLLGLAGDNITTLWDAGGQGVRIINQGGTANLAYFSPTGDLTVTGDVTAYSDDSLKTNWLALPGNFLELLAKVKHGVYERKDTKQIQAGVSAQSLEAALAPVVSTSANGKKSVAYGNAALLACIQLAERLLCVEQELAALKGA